VEPAEAPPVDAEGLAECPGATAGMRIDPVAALTYVYPAQREQRKYQLSITRKALFTNTLVCLPTGLGKTLIAAVLMYNYYRWFPKGKVVFLAPTRPLVQQQAEACRLSLGIPRGDMCELTGSSRKDGDGRRGGLWAAHRVFFATPQTFANDLRDGVCPAASIVALVLDEAHRATGQYAYVTAVRHLTDAGVRFRLLALSATPGTTGDAVQSVLRNLHIGAVEYRSEEDADVAPYTFRRQVDLRVVHPTATMRDLEAAYSDGFRPMVEELGRMGVIHNAYDAQALLVSPFAFITARKALLANETLQGVLGPRVGRAHFLLTACGLLARGLQQLQSEGIKAALDYILMRKEDFDKVNSPALNKVLRDLQSAAAGGESHAPKLAELVKVLREHFTAAASGAGPGGEASASTRAIVFTSARESVRHIIEELKELSTCGVAASEFVGQGDSNAKGSGRERKKGQTQAEQTAILAKFRKGELNVIVATCIGEEGLDVPQVDLVVFMDAVGIIRLVQRMGRTGCASLAFCIASAPSISRV
jgi:Fanconi anemia group M protein